MSEKQSQRANILLCKKEIPYPKVQTFKSAVAVVRAIYKINCKLDWIPKMEAKIMGRQEGKKTTSDETVQPTEVGRPAMNVYRSRQGTLKELRGGLFSLILGAGRKFIWYYRKDSREVNYSTLTGQVLFQNGLMC